MLNLKLPSVSEFKLCAAKLSSLALTSMDHGVDVISDYLDDLDQHIKDSHKIEQVYLYVRKEMDKARTMDKKIPHKGSLEDVENALEAFVQAWNAYEEGPRSLGAEEAQAFTDLYESDKGFEMAYRAKFKEMIDALAEGVADRSELNKIQKELTSKYKYHHKVKLGQLKDLLAMEETHRRNAKDHILKRLEMRLTQAIAGRTKGADLTNLIKEAHSTLNILATMPSPPVDRAEIIRAQLEKIE